MLKNLLRLCSRLRWPARRRSPTKVVIKRFSKTKTNSNSHLHHEPTSNGPSSATVHPNGQPETENPPPPRPIRVATFNAALFSMAPAIPTPEKPERDENGLVKDIKNATCRPKSAMDRPKSILKQSPLHPNAMKSSENQKTQQKFVKSKMRVSINLPDNEISLLKSRQLSFAEGRELDTSNSLSSFSPSRVSKGKGPLKPSVSFPNNIGNCENGEYYTSHRTVLEVLRELDADILALQDVKAEEEKEMKPLSDLAAALGMNYVFAESWAPEYGNAILSKWPIKRSKVQKIFDDSDFRNVLKATIDVPQAGEVNFQCTHLDHLDENWRMRQVNAIIQSSNEPHILAGGLNSLEESDYSQERWTDIVKYYEEMGKPTPKVEVMRYLKSKQYTDAKDFEGEYESVVMIAKGQSVQGTCKYGTRVDYILASSNSPYKFVPGSYSVFSSKGTSDHHIVRVDVLKSVSCCDPGNVSTRRQRKQKVIKITETTPSKGIWKTQT
ncbi:PREDICTED: uncharacterized protein LOC101302029 [Fragaria vesca subsp. vesca]|uniref:uncharacterized protein LOC101302029 n=1 Tax=Fragaria vesca subsp. vesca TaxID=101020 RepID=UPI0002C2FCA9|nr:PREDICTED: uncharacterized protein LOC101302029 [Fragaria vesca subsp. vesca]